MFFFVFMLTVLSVLIYWRFTKGFTLTKGYQIFLVSVMLFFPALLGGSGLFWELFAIRIKWAYSLGLMWALYLPLLFSVIILAEGLSLLNLNKRRWWLLGSLGIFFINMLFILFRGSFYYLTLASVQHAQVRDALSFVILWVIYKIIIRTQALTDTQRGKLIVFFCLIIIPDYLDLFPSRALLLISFCALVYVRITSGLSLAKPQKRLLLGILGLCFILGIPQMTFWGNGIGLPGLYFIGGICVGLMITAVFLFLLDGLLDWLTEKYRYQRVILLLLITLISTGYGVFHALEIPSVKERLVPLKNLPPSMSGFSIVQISDVHLGDLTSPGWFSKTVDKVNGLKPDIIVLTGDLIDNGIGNGRGFLESLKKLNANYGVFAVTGNHDYYGGRLPVFFRLCTEAGIVVLQNEWRALQTPGGVLQVVGLNDIRAFHHEGDENVINLKTATMNMDKMKPTILLFHRPFLPRGITGSGIGLQLAGHTHAGQMPVLAIFAYLMNPYFYGLYHVEDTYLNVSSGTALYAIPLRLCSDNELVYIKLVPEQL